MTFVFNHSQKEKLQAFVDELFVWSQKMNLIGRSTQDDIWTRHVEDSVQLVPYVSDEKSQIVDIGSGAGFPGIVLGILKPNKITLIEKDQKKSMFLTHMKSLLHLDNIEIVGHRWEDVPLESFDIFTARAFAPLSQLCDVMKRVVKSNGVGLFLKGRSWNDEIQEAKKQWNFDVCVERSKIDAKGVMLCVRNLRSR